MINLDSIIEKNRLTAFVDGFLGGLGFVLIVWGLASIITLPATSANVYIGLILLGVSMFAGGTCHQAYAWGRISVQPNLQTKVLTPQTQPVADSESTAEPLGKYVEPQVTSQEQMDLNKPTTEETIEYPVETQTHEALVYEEEKKTET